MGVLSAAAARAPARVLLQGEDGTKVPVSPQSRVRFLRADGSSTPWLCAGDLWLSADGVLVRHRHPLEALREVRITGLDRDGVQLLVQAAPAGALALDLGEGVVALQAAPGPLAEWVRKFVVSLAQRRAPRIFHKEGQGFALLSPPTAVQRYARVIADLRRETDGSFLGVWGLAVRSEELHWVRASELLRTLDEGLELLDGLRFVDLRSLQVERFDAGKTIAAIVVTGLSVLTGLALTVVTAPFGGDRGLGRVVTGIGDGVVPGPAGEPTGYSLWIDPLPTPLSAGAHPLFEKTNRNPSGI